MEDTQLLRRLAFPARAALLAAVLWAPSARAQTDDYLRGYVSAIVEREWGQPAYSVEVEEGAVTLSAPEMNDKERDALAAEIERIEGVRSVAWLDPEPRQSLRAGAPLAQQQEARGLLFPREDLFNPLIADPLWPHFSGKYLFYPEDEELRSIASANLGGSFSFYRLRLTEHWQAQVGLQAAVFAIFDLDAPSFDLVNADYWIAVPLSLRRGRFSAQTRVFHQSSHLGDEYLLRNPIDRVNLSYEGVDLKAAWDWGKWARTYAGGGYLFSRFPDELDPWSALYGFELYSPELLLKGKLRPVFGAHFTQRESESWDISTALSAGFQLTSLRSPDRSVYLLLDYFNGRSPNGQFYERRVEYWGAGVHFYF